MLKISFDGRVVLTVTNPSIIDMCLSLDGKGKPDGGRAGVVRRATYYRMSIVRDALGRGPGLDEQSIAERIGEIRANMNMYLHDIRKVKIEVVEPTN